MSQGGVKVGASEYLELGGEGGSALETFQFALDYQTMDAERLEQPPSSSTREKGISDKVRGFKVVGRSIQITLKGQKYYKIVFSSPLLLLCLVNCRIIIPAPCRGGATRLAVMKAFVAFFDLLRVYWQKLEVSEKRQCTMDCKSLDGWEGGKAGWMRPFKGCGFMIN